MKKYISNHLYNLIKRNKNPWQSWDNTPWKHPWLTRENLVGMRAYSQEKREELRKLVSDTDPKMYSFGFCGGMANNLYTRAVSLRRLGINIQMFLHPQDQYVMSHPIWEEYEDTITETEININELIKENIKIPIIQDVHCFEAIYNLEKEVQAKSTTFLNPNLIKKFPSYHIFINTYTALQSMDAILTTQVPYFGYLSNRPYIAAQSGGDLWYEASRNDELGNLQRESFANADMILVSNPWTYAHARRYNFKHLIYLPLILDDETYKPGIGKSRAAWQEKSGGSFFVLVTARLDKYCKGYSYWLEAVVQFLRIIPSARLCVIKWGKDEKEFLETLKKFEIQDKVIILPMSGKSLVRDYLRSADCLIDQFIVGYYGATALEAMGCGLPVIARFEMEQYAATCETGAPPILNAKSKEEVLNHLLNLVNLPEMKIRAAADHRQWFMENHSAKRWNEDLLSVLIASANRKEISFKNSPLQMRLSKEEKKYHKENLLNAPIFPNYFLKEELLKNLIQIVS